MYLDFLLLWKVDIWAMQSALLTVNPQIKQSICDYKKFNWIIAYTITIKIVGLSCIFLCSVDVNNYVVSK